MSRRSGAWIGMFVGSTLGSMLPLLWGGSMLSLSSIFWGGVGGILGIWLAWQYGP